MITSITSMRHQHARMRRHALCTYLVVILAGCMLSSTSPVGATDFASKVQQYGQLLDRLHAYQPELPRELLSLATGFQGDRSRLERVLVKLIRGQPVSIALLGGSLSLRGWNHPDESYISQVHKWLELTFVEGCREEAEARRADELRAGSGKQSNSEDSRGERLLHDSISTYSDSKPRSSSSSSSSKHRHRRAMLAGLHEQRPDQGLPLLPPRRSTRGNQFEEDPRPDVQQDLHVVSSSGYLASGHMCSSSQIKLQSLAVPASGPGYAERCALQHLPEDVDLVLLDFGCNDYFEGRTFSHPERHAFERILRHSLSQPTRPAVLLFEAFSWLQSYGKFYSDGAGKQGSLAQDKHQLIAEYYGEVQVLSVRAALYQLMNATDDVKRLVYIGAWHGTADFLHVSLLGHRWYADIIINYLRDVATNVISRMIAHEAVQAVASTSAAVQLLEHNLQPDQGGSSSSVVVTDGGSCEVVGRRGVSFAVQCSQALPGLKPPFFPSNEVHPFGVCAVESGLQGLVTSPHPYWDWVDEAGNSSTYHKWGFVSTTPGAELTISLPLGSGHLAGVSDRKHGEPDIYAWLIFLESYTNMGAASVACAGACECEPFEVDSQKPIKASVPALVGFGIWVKDGEADLPEQARVCDIKVQVLERTSSGGHKFKVIGITTSATSIWHIENSFQQGLQI